MNKNPYNIIEKLNIRKNTGSYRFLKKKCTGIDFCSNDYLGLSSNNMFLKSVNNLLCNNINLLKGSTGSRLLNGNSEILLSIENFISKQHNVEAALIFPSGYKANLGLFSCIFNKDSTLLVDECIHASIHDGALLSRVRKWKFKHNNLNHLESLLQKINTKYNFVAIESIYSMDGDIAPIHDIICLCENYKCFLIVDEAHAMGVFQKGLLYEHKLQNRVFATIVTYGKGYGIQGAAVLGSKELIEYLINFSRPFIYSTAMSDYQALLIKYAYLFINKNTYIIKKLHDNINFFLQKRFNKLNSNNCSPIQILKFNSLNNLRKASIDLIDNNLFVYPIYYPTVKLGEERLRICIHAFNSYNEINQLYNIIYNNEEY